MGSQSPSKTRWTPEIIARLGKESDRVIASSLGVTLSAVGIKRRMLGIPAHAKSKQRWTRSMISRLGKVPDALIASTYDLDFQAVYRKRRSLGIPGWAEK